MSTCQGMGIRPRLESGERSSLSLLLSEITYLLGRDVVVCLDVGCADLRVLVGREPQRLRLTSRGHGLLCLNSGNSLLGPWPMMRRGTADGKQTRTLTIHESRARKSYKIHS